MKLRSSSAIILAFALSAFTALPARADDEDDQTGSFACADAVNVMDCIEKTQKNAPVIAQPEEAPMSTQQLGLYGPFSAAVRYDTVLGWIPELNFVQTFYDNGISFQLGYGANEQRANITLGHAFTANQQIKITYEYLKQNLPFDFVSGSANEWVSQNAFGAAYRFLFPNQTLRSINLNGYYIHANSKDLSDVIFYQNNDAYLNLRRIAGGTEQTVTTGVTLAPWHQLLINVGGGYSHLVYDTKYEDNQDTATLAYNAGLDLLITPRTKLSTSIANSAAETDSSVKISQILPRHVEAAVTGQYSQGQAGQPNSTRILLALSYPATTYAVAPNDTLGTLKTWIEKPVIRAPRVLAIKDEQVVKYSISASNPPTQAVPTGQMIQALHTQDIFSFDPALYDKVVYSLSLADNSNNLSDPQSQLNITVQQDSNSPYNATIYSTAPLPNSAAPTGGQTVYHIIITALGYKNGLTTPIQSKADFELDVNFNKDNEPKWVTTTGAINFDATDTATAINLNSLTNQSTNPEAIKFSFDDPSKYPNWALLDSSGTWYLMRKADVNGAFDAADISSSTPQNLMISVQYANDPPGVSVPSQKLSITVKPDTKITFAWLDGSACQIANMPAAQPTNPQTYALNLAPCTLYKDASSNVLKVKNDTISYAVSSTGSYPNSLNISGTGANSQLQVGGPTGGLGASYTVGLNVKSKAQGGSSPSAQALSANNVISVGDILNINAETGQNTYQFQEEGTWLTSVVINGLDDKKYYQITSSNPAVSNYTLQCSGAITNDNDYKNCNKQPYSPPLKSSKGQVSVMWFSLDTYPTVTSITIMPY